MTGTAFERLRVALEQHGSRVTGSGDRLSAQCPAHDDGSPSLSVTGIQGQTLVYCHAGCATDDVLAAVGLHAADLFDEQRGVDYRYGDGRTVHRTPAKRFWQQGNTRGSELYRLDRVRVAVAAGHTVYVVEGEKDVHALDTLSVTATCSAMGAGKAHKADWTPLRGAKVVIIADKDTAGERHAIDVNRILLALDATVDVRMAAAGKDAADHVAAGHSIDDLVPAALPVDTDTDEYVVGNPDGRPIDEVHAGGDVPALNVAELYPALDWAAVWERGTDEPEWLVEPILERGRLYALWSKAGTGKSLLALEIAAALAAGRPVLGNPARYPVVTLYVDLENTVEDLVERLSAFGYGPSDLGKLRYLSFPNLPALDSLNGGRHLVAAVEHYGADLVVIDTLSRVVEGKENDSDTYHALYRYALAPLKALGVTVLRLDHQGKDAEKGQRGSSAKDSDVDVVWQLEQVTAVAFRLRIGKHRNNHHPERVDLERRFSPLRHDITRETGLDPAVAEVVAHMDRLAIPTEHGRPRVVAALAADGIKASNVNVSAAIKHRRSSFGQPKTCPGQLEGERS